MSTLQTHREALYAELFGDIEKLLTRAEELHDALPESMTAAASNIEAAGRKAVYDMEAASKRDRRELASEVDKLLQHLKAESARRVDYGSSGAPIRFAGGASGNDRRGSAPVRKTINLSWLKWFHRGKRAADLPNHYTVAPPRDLLKDFEPELVKISRAVGVPQAYWDSLYLPIFDNYAAFVQRLPGCKANFLNQGGLLHYGITVALRAILCKRAVSLPPGSPPEKQSHSQDLWTYACLTGALLYDLGTPLEKFRVFIREPDGELVPWLPVTGPMHIGAHYKIKQVDALNIRRSAPLLVHYLIPPAGLAWLASDPGAFSTWGAAISGQLDEAGPLGELIAKAHERAVSPQRHDESTASAPAQKAVKETPSDDQLARGPGGPEEDGTGFLDWLAQQIRQQTIAINSADAAIHVLPEGLALVSPTIFQKFSPNNWERAQKNFLKQRVHRMAGQKNTWTCLHLNKAHNPLVKIYLIPDAETLLGISLPNSNPDIALSEKSNAS